MPYFCTLMLSILLSFVTTNLYAPIFSDAEGTTQFLARLNEFREQSYKQMNEAAEARPSDIEKKIDRTRHTLSSGEKDRRLYTIGECFPGLSYMPSSKQEFARLLAKSGKGHIFYAPNKPKKITGRTVSVFLDLPDINS